MIGFLKKKQDALRQERQFKDRLGREKDVLIAEKFNLEQQLAVSLVKTHANRIIVNVK